MIRVNGFRAAVAHCQHYIENTQNFCLIPSQGLIGRIVPISSVCQLFFFFMILATHIQEICTLVRKLIILLWVKTGKGWEGVLPDRGLKVDKGDSYQNTE